MQKFRAIMRAERYLSRRMMLSAMSAPVIIVGVTGSIAAYKAADLVSKLVKRGFEVHVAMTHGAQEFVTPLTFQTLSRNPVITSVFDEKRGWKPGHIDLADRADLLLVAPATANIIAELAHGLAGNPHRRDRARHARAGAHRARDEWQDVAARRDAGQRETARARAAWNSSGPRKDCSRADTKDSAVCGMSTTSSSAPRRSSRKKNRKNFARENARAPRVMNSRAELRIAREAA